MQDDLVAGLPARDALADLPDDPGGVRAADVVVLAGGSGRRRRAAERRPDVVEVHAGRHHAHDDLEGAGLGYRHLLELEGVQRLALALLADHPGGHRGGQLARLDVQLATRLVSTAMGADPTAAAAARAAARLRGRRRAAARRFGAASAVAARLGLGAGARCAGRGADPATQRRPRRRAATAALILMRSPRASTNAGCAALDDLLGGAPPAPAPEPRPSTSRVARAPAGTLGSACSRSCRPSAGDERAERGDAERAADHPEHRERCRRRRRPWSRSTAFIAAVLIGDITSPMPRPMQRRTRRAGNA